jgi:hypothetical protein
MKEIIIFIKSILTPEQWNILFGWFLQVWSHAEQVAVVAVLIFATTQIIKIGWRLIAFAHKRRPPSDPAIHLIALLASAFWSMTMIRENIINMLTMIVLAWFVTWLAVTYGAKFLKVYYPPLWTVINLDRRTHRRRRGPPSNIERRGT